MSIWVPKSDITREIGAEILKETTIIEELSDYDIYQGTKPRMVKMCTQDPLKTHFIIPYMTAIKRGYKPINMRWRQTVFPYTLPDGTVKHYPEFTGTFRDYQAEVIPEIMDCIKRNNTVIIGLPPGWGKTIMAAYIIQMCGGAAFIGVKQIKVYQSWKKTFEKVLPGMVVWCVGDMEKPMKWDICLCMEGRLSSVGYLDRMECMTVVLDETHTLCTPTQVELFLGFQPKYIIYETATLKASGLWRMAAVCSGEEGVFRISKVPYNFYVIRTGIHGAEDRDVKGKLKPASVQRSLIENNTRKTIVEALILNHVQYRKFICLQTVTKDIDDNITAMNKLGISCDTLWGTKNNYSQSQVLFGTYGKISTGFDEENACDNFWTSPVKSDTMIFINSVNKAELLIQSMGRCMRTQDEIPAFFFLLDENSNVKNHLKNNKWLIAQTNGVIKEVDYRTPFVPMNPKFGYKFSFRFTPGEYYKLLPAHEYDDFIRGGFLQGNEKEREDKRILLQTKDILQAYRSYISPNGGKCFLLTLQHINVITYQNPNDGLIYPFINQGFAYCEHRLFFRHIVGCTQV